MKKTKGLILSCLEKVFCQMTEIKQAEVNSAKVEMYLDVARSYMSNY